MLCKQRHYLFIALAVDRQIKQYCNNFNVHSGFNGTMHDPLHGREQDI